MEMQKFFQSHFPPGGDGPSLAMQILRGGTGDTIRHAPELNVAQAPLTDYCS